MPDGSPDAEVVALHQCARGEIGPTGTAVASAVARNGAGAPVRLGVVGRRVSIAIVVAVVAVLMTGCRVDVVVDVTMEQNGSGTVTVTLTADADVVRTAPGLAADLRLDDLRAAGWTTDGPVGTPSGGLSIALVHTFDTPGQATALLASLNGPDGPFEAIAFTREATDDEITYRMTGQAKANGLNGFADPDLIAAVGATPWVADAEAAGVDPDDAVSLTYTVTLPGVVDETTAASDTPPLSWTVPFDDTAVEVTTRSTESLATGRGWSLLGHAQLRGPRVVGAAVDRGHRADRPPTAPAPAASTFARRSWSPSSTATTLDDLDGTRSGTDRLATQAMLGVGPGSPEAG